MRYALSCGYVILTLAGASAADNWPQFRGPTGDGRAAANAAPPTSWTETDNVRWKTAIPGKGWSSPVIWGGQIWMTTARPDGKEKFAVCVDRSTGKILHNISLFPEAKPAFCIDYNSYATPTPVIEDGRVYVHFGSAGTACLDTTTGETVWQRTDLKCDHWRGPGSSPIVFEKLLILTFDGHDVNYVAALDKETGKTVWKKDRDIKYASNDGDYHKAYSTPTILTQGGKPQLVSPAADATIAYDPRSGAELWRVHTGGMNEACKPVAGDGLVYLSSGHTKNLLAVKLGGNGDLTADVAWKTNKSVPSRPSFLLDGDLLYLVSDDGFASCLEAKTGQRLWSERLGGAFSASPLLAGGRLYFAGEDGKTHVLAADRQYKPLAVNVLSAGCMASPAALGDALYLRTKTHLYCIAGK